MDEPRFVGIMSGTSLDGVDAVLVGFGQGRLECQADCHTPYDDDLRRQLLELHERGMDELHRAALLSNRLARTYAATVDRLLEIAGIGAGAVSAIGCHGQTVRHVPSRGYSLQLNNPALLAELTGLTVVADFRSRDIAAGGQGAPLVPAFHDDRFRALDRHRVIINIGGIANVTNLAPAQPTTGFDCGPGNMLLDAWCQTQTNQPYDADGHFARQGRPLPELIEHLLHHPFLSLPPPKSCGREEFNLGWLQGFLSGQEAAADVQATLTEFTATTIAEAIGRHCGHPDEVFVCGGGARNGALMAALAGRLPDSRIGTTAALGLEPERVEATAFAWLAWRTTCGRPGNLPEVTGARGQRLLGAIYPA